MNGEPSDAQLKNCLVMGWAHLGDGLFAKDDYLGWFEQRTFVKVYAPGKRTQSDSQNPHIERSGLNDRGHACASTSPDRGAP